MPVTIVTFLSDITENRLWELLFRSKYYPSSQEDVAAAFMRCSMYHNVSQRDAVSSHQHLVSPNGGSRW